MQTIISVNIVSLLTYSYYVDRRVWEETFLVSDNISVKLLYIVSIQLLNWSYIWNNKKKRKI